MQTFGYHGKMCFKYVIMCYIYIFELPDNIRSSVRLFADDCVLYRNIHSIQDCFILQEDLTSLGQWEAD